MFDFLSRSCQSVPAVSPKYIILISILDGWAARYLFIASLLVLLLEFIGPVFFQLFPDIVTLIPGPWLRMIAPGLASLLAFAGLLAYFRPGQRWQ